MKKIYAVLYRNLHILKTINNITILIFIFAMYMLLVAGGKGGILKYHNEVVILEEVSCNKHSQECEVIGKVNDEYLGEFIIFDFYKDDVTYYQQCGLYVFSWLCSERLLTKPGHGYYKHYNDVRGK